MTENKSASYRDAGVDIDAGNRLVERIKPLVKATHRDGVLGGIGGFGGLFELAKGKWNEPVLVAGADGVGTKLRLAIETGRHDTVGIDLVAMCANDVVVQGAEPLFFLDYYASGRLDENAAEAVIGGIAEGCRQAGAALLGGETAEMPGMYADGDYDLAGFCVGIVEKAALIDGSRIAPGDRIIGLASTGPHSNGYSLIRKVLSDRAVAADMPFDDRTIGEVLLTPTRIYVRSVLDLAAQLPVHGLVHVTGGGLAENTARVLPAHADASMRPDAWERPAIFDWLQSQGNIPEEEMLRTFNCGIGMVVIVPADRADEALERLEASGEDARIIGEITAGSGQAYVRA